MSLRHYVKRFFAPNKVVVLMYHRVAELKADPWQLAVSPANFEAQLKLLEKKYKVITPQQVLEQVARKSIRKNQVCITFDDGYLDNYTTAMPLLEKYRCPATFFIATHYLQTGQPYWWDELQEIIFSTPKLPSPFSFTINGDDINYVLENEGWLTNEQRAKQNAWVWSEEQPTRRCALYFLLWEKMLPLPQHEIERLLAKLKKMAGVDLVNMNHSMPMSLSELNEMSRHPLLQIGLHTHTHPALSYHNTGVQRQELEKNKNMLEEVCQSPMRTLSYPHGRYNEDTLSVVKESNVAVAFTTKHKSVTSHSSPYQLGRYQVLNWGEDQFASFLKKRFSM